MLYGSSRYYRDHVVHVFRTWLTGVVSLTKNRGVFLDFIAIEAGAINLSRVEKISIWTIIALTHDLGYPLEKARDIINTTRSMMETFVTNPDISMDLAFHGVQNYMNDFIVRLMSSKMIEVATHKNESGQDDERGHEKEYVARLQPKYYFKFQKSLEKIQHGIVSALIVYKLLTYFLESDFNINEDYRFQNEERRQFYIRREILRAIASHTCDDIYHLYLGTFAFLLIISDDTQEWGRKSISELYVSSDDAHDIGEIDISINSAPNPNHTCKLEEITRVNDDKGVGAVIALISRLVEQSRNYVTIFRDGQDTEKRDFSFTRKYSIEYGSPKVTFSMTLSIPKNDASTLVGDIAYSTTDTANKIFGEAFRIDLQKEVGLNITLTITDNDSLPVNISETDNCGKWRNGKLTIDLSK